MFTYDSVSNLQRAKEETARISLGTFVGENKEQIADLAHKKLNKGEEVEKISVKASVEVGDYCYQEASVEIEKMSIFRRIYLVLMKVDHRDIFINETVCGLALIITIRVFVSR
ncbi:MAG: hypothetical protein WC428_05135 [Candidatus Paceibacterota bacterium]|jgi:hypothetical protein